MWTAGLFLYESIIRALRRKVVKYTLTVSVQLLYSAGTTGRGRGEVKGISDNPAPRGWVQIVKHAQI